MQNQIQKILERKTLKYNLKISTERQAVILTILMFVASFNPTSVTEGATREFIKGGRHKFWLNIHSGSFVCSNFLQVIPKTMTSGDEGGSGK